MAALQPGFLPPSTIDDQDPYVGVACWMREIGARTGKSMADSLPPISKTRYLFVASRCRSR
jgi:hypothetical protein